VSVFIRVLKYIFYSWDLYFEGKVCMTGNTTWFIRHRVRSIMRDSLVLTPFVSIPLIPLSSGSDSLSILINAVMMIPLAFSISILVTLFRELSN